MQAVVYVSDGYTDSVLMWMLMAKNCYALIVVMCVTYVCVILQKYVAKIIL